MERKALPQLNLNMVTRYVAVAVKSSGQLFPGDGGELVAIVILVISKGSTGSP